MKTFRGVLVRHTDKARLFRSAVGVERWFAVASFEYYRNDGEGIAHFRLKTKDAQNTARNAGFIEL